MQEPDEKGTPAPFMRVPKFKGEPLSVMSRLTQTGAPAHLWHYTLKLTPMPGSLNTINRLTEQGYEPVKDDKETGRQKGELTAILFSQLHDLVATHDNGQVTIWAHHQSIEFVKKHPVLLSFTLKGEDHPESEHIQMLQLLPLPRYGEYAVIMDHEPKKASVYSMHDLNDTGLKIKTALGENILDLAGESLPNESPWMTISEPHAYCASELQYLAIRTDLLSDLLRKRGKKRQETMAALEKLEKAHHEVVNLRQSWLRPDWLHQWKVICHMAQELAANYYDHHKKKQQQETPFIPPLPSLTSNHQTKLPSNNAFRGLEQSFGPAIIKNSLWDDKSNAQEHQIHTPNGSLLRIQGRADFERKALTQYINEMRGVEGLKHLLILLDTYYAQTGGQDQHSDIIVSLRQLLKRMNYNDSKIDDLEERRKLAHTILYLSRTFVTSTETQWEEQEGPRGGRRPGRKNKKHNTMWTPLLVIEGMKPSEDGGLSVPDEIKFHLGEAFYNSLFGEHPQFFTLPTLKVLEYHAQKEQQELCLSFYLTNMLFVNHKFSIHFRELAHKSGLLSEEAMDNGKNRTRDAVGVMYALEHLERDSLIKRGAHEGLDTVLAVDLFMGKSKEKDLAPATLQRIKKSYSHLRGYNTADLLAKRRKAIQRLLSEVTKFAINFDAGSLMQQRIEQREEQRQKAKANDEDLLRSRLIKAATQAAKQEYKRIVDTDIVREQKGE